VFARLGRRVPVSIDTKFPTATGGRTKKVHRKLLDQTKVNNHEWVAGINQIAAQISQIKTAFCFGHLGTPGWSKPWSKP
jgi:hypothetical protein